MMTIHPLHAGNGYEYLLRQVATGDEMRPKGESMTDYYLTHGNPPGRWVGKGADVLRIKGQVKSEQMRNLFGTGTHPNDENVRLGRRFMQFRRDRADAYHAALDAAFKAFAVVNDRGPQAGAERDRIRWQVATEMVRQDHDVEEPSEAEVARFLAQRAGVNRDAVAGYDLVFTPVKSVSVLWALADAETRREITEAHTAAWRRTVAWIESEGALTRAGAGGLRQINTHGLTAAAFDHFDSRSGDPNLHTHVAVSTKVRSSDGKWRSLDGRVLFSLAVSASERYNTLIEQELVSRLGVRFEPTSRPGGRVPVREIAGVGDDLCRVFSQRRQAINDSYAELVAQYRAAHGHEPPRAAQYKMAQQATLDTRMQKETGIPLAERVQQWRARATRALGSEVAVRDRVAAALAPEAPSTPRSPETVEQIATSVLEAMGYRRATWTRFHVHAEALRHARGSVLTEHERDADQLAAEVVDQVLAASVPLTIPNTDEHRPPELSRADGESIYTVHGAEKYTSMGVLNAEEQLLRAAAAPGGFVVPGEVFQSAVADAQIDNQVRLDASQIELARRFACGPNRIEVGIGPAGTGKTTAMRAFAAAVTAAGGRVLGLAPSAVAAGILADELGTHAETMHKLIDVYARGNVPAELLLDEDTVIVIDEAGMAGTLEIQAVLELATRAGAAVRLLGDPSQLDAVGAGGALRMIANTIGAAELRDVYRFRIPGEDEAGLLVRDGRAAGLDFYIDNARVHTGSRESALEEIYAAWVQDHAAGRNAIMIAANNDDVASLNTRCRLHRSIEGLVEPQGIDLADGTIAGVGDVIVTRRNDRRLRHGHTDYVKNGDMWIVTARHGDGSLVVRHRVHKTTTRLPAWYVREHVQLGYASTIHRAQGMTVDVARVLVDAGLTREHLYTAITRGRHGNDLYVVTEELLDASLHHQARPDVAARAVLEGVLTRTTVGEGALATLHEEAEQAGSLARLVPAYEDAYAHLLDPEAIERTADAVGATLGPDLAHPILEDESWPNLAALLVRHQRNGADLDWLLRRHAEDLHDARSPATLLYWRIGEPVAARADHETSLPSWVTPPPQHPSREDPTAATTDADPPKPDRWHEIVDLNVAAFEWWQRQARDAPWAARYLQDRAFSPAPEHGVAPAGWTGLVNYLRGEGVSDAAMLVAGLASRTRTGRLIDRFRDRVIIPVRDGDDAIIAFTARANPATSTGHTPKWLNPPTTPAYRKAEVLLGLDADAKARLRAGARPVFVEGAFDLEAVRRVGDPMLVPLAGCGTALTREHLRQVRDLCPDTMAPIFAFDADRAGHRATGRVWSMLTDDEAALASSAILPGGADPGSLLEDGHLDNLRCGLLAAQPTTEELLDRLVEASPHQFPEQRLAVVRSAATIIARLRDEQAFMQAGEHLARRLSTPDGPWGEHTLARETVWVELQQVRAHHRASSPVPPARTDNPAIAAWLRHETEQIAQRLDALVDRVAHHPPSWAADLPSPPALEDTLRIRWDGAIRAIVAYRDRYEIDGPQPLGTSVAHGVQAKARAEAAAALHALGVDSRHKPDPERARQLVREEQLARREQMLQALDDLRGDRTGPACTDNTHETLLQHLNEKASTGPIDGPSLA
ncbi:MobF family relaxase [Occultella aeris]|uniref:DNA primase n=1 Tax=Occultella aeris TaxID=2761496 RepID=A0A7M4DJS7_9MICO|nr:MobF family relaxase [Occultella aeris]VZO37312.1 DNA primase [Occultella aeris]